MGKFNCRQKTSFQRSNLPSTASIVLFGDNFKAVNNVIWTTFICISDSASRQRQKQSSSTKSFLMIIGLFPSQFSQLFSFTPFTIFQGKLDNLTVKVKNISQRPKLKQRSRNRQQVLTVE